MPSTVIASILYDEQALTLTISYTSGQTYVYKQVPENVYRALQISTAKGRYLHNYIKGNYEFEKIS